jgi:methylenetetrahydrofolate reductase (NADPH)
MRDNVPGVHIPDSIIKRLLGADNQKEEGTKICIEMIQRIREIDGVHVMAYRQEESVPEIINASGVLGGRSPWFPSAAGP